ncbi:hypothetical protein EFT87_03270 [Schleiferilactobacillus harbinensis]|nr:hypothetical protein [Schleiferilactobacillus harbinensis]
MQEIRHFLIGNFLHFTAGVNIDKFNVIISMRHILSAKTKKLFCIQNEHIVAHIPVQREEDAGF